MFFRKKAKALLKKEKIPLRSAFGIMIKGFYFRFSAGADVLE